MQADATTRRLTAAREEAETNANKRTGPQADDPRWTDTRRCDLEGLRRRWPLHR